MNTFLCCYKLRHEQRTIYVHRLIDAKDGEEAAKLAEQANEYIPDFRLKSIYPFTAENLPLLYELSGGITVLKHPDVNPVLGLAQ